MVERGVGQDVASRPRPEPRAAGRYREPGQREGCAASATPDSTAVRIARSSVSIPSSTVLAPSAATSVLTLG